MFKSARWRSERNKIKAVFKLQFHATQVSQLNVDALVLSVVPADIRKPTVRLEKAAITDGSCRWESPVYEMVMFSQDLKTRKIRDKLCSFIVSNGLSKNSSIGDVSINFADYAEATKGSIVSLPLKNSKSNMVLHVSIQRLQDDDQREFVEPEDMCTKPQKAFNPLLSNDESDEGIHRKFNEETQLNNGHHKPEVNACCAVSSGSDMTMSSSGSSSGLDTPRDAVRGTRSIEEHTASLLLVPRNLSSNEFATIYEKQQQSQCEETADYIQGTSTDSLSNEPQQAFDIEIKKLKAEVVALSRQLDLSELELQTLRKQIVKESKRGQDLSRESTILKEERDLLKIECEKLKTSLKHREETKRKNKLPFESRDASLLEEIRQELSYEKEMNANLRLQLQKTQESNAELMLAVKDLEEMMEQNSNKIPNLSKKPSFNNTIFPSDSDDDEEQKALDVLVKEHTDAKELYELEQKIMDLRTEVEIYRRDKDELEMQMEQLALDYEILRQEKHEILYKLEQSQLQEQLKMQYECSPSFADINDLEARIESLESELTNQSKDYSNSLETIGKLKNQIKILEEELEKQAQGLEVDGLKHATVEQELRSQIESLESELKSRSKDYSNSLETINDLEAQIGGLRNELNIRSKDYSDSLETINGLQNQIESLKNERTSWSKDCSDSLETINGLEAQIRCLENELKSRSKDCSDSLETINGLEAQIGSLENELKSRSNDYADSLETIDEMKNHIKNLEEELAKQAQRFKSDLEATRARVEHEKSAQLEILESELKNQSKDYSNSLETIKDLEAQIERLQSESKSQSDNYSNSLATINELKHHIRNLEEELERQAQAFETDLEAVTRAKVEQEQRAIWAEEALRKMRLKNAKAAEKLQGEIRKLSVQMTSSFNANEKMAMKALAEASGLRTQKSQLEVMLQNAIKELQSVRNSYESKLLDLQNQLNSKISQIERLSNDVEARSKQLEDQKVHKEELAGTFSQEILMLKLQLEKLSVDNNALSEEAVEKENMRKELENMKASIKHAEALLEQGHRERNELVSTIALMKKEEDKSLEDLKRMRCLFDEKEADMHLLQAEVKTLQAECNKLQNSLSEEQIQKENFRMQVLKLKDDIKRKTEEFASIEELEASNNCSTSKGTESIIRDNGSNSADDGPKHVASLREKIKLLKGQIKIKETALEAATDSFLEKEGELLEKIQELENRIVELHENSRPIFINSGEKSAMVTDATISTIDMQEGSSNTDGTPGSTACMSKSDIVDDITCDTKALLSELETLKERNESMECELKELQGRYSEISLKFAEVEGERQQLVMKLRNIKNSKKK